MVNEVPPVRQLKPLVRSGAAVLMIVLIGCELAAQPGPPRSVAAVPSQAAVSTSPSPVPVTIRQFLDGAKTWGEARLVRVEGTVTHSISDKTYFIQDGDAGVYVFHKPDRAFRVGERVEVTGYPSLGNLAPTLQLCTARALGKGALPPPLILDGPGSLSVRQSMKLVRMQGFLSEGSLMQGRRLALRPRDGGPTFEVNMEALPRVDTVTPLDQGSLLEVTGVLTLRAGRAGDTPAATILVRTADDIVVRAGPPRWNLRVVQRTLAVTGGALALALAWVLTLRREVKRQTVLVEHRFEREAALRASEDRFAKVFRASPDSVMVVRASDDCVLDVNPAFERLIGHTRDTIVGSRLSDLHLWTDVAQRETLRQELSSAGSLTNVECRLKPRSGSDLFCLCSAETIELNGERCELHVLRDVTERRQAEESRLALQNQLQQAQKMESLGTLAGGIAHDFNNILGAILGNVELMLLPGHSTESTADHLTEIRKACLRAREMVRQILTFSRKRDLVRTAIAPQKEMVEAARLLRALLPASIEIVTQLEDPSPPVLADASQIHQILLNLGTNGWHAMEGSPIPSRLTLSLRPVQVDAALLARSSDLHPGAYVCLSVADQGSGMDPATRERIFEPFFSTKGPGKGTGLGLAVVHGIVRDLEGAILVDSEPGRGSVFSVYIPAAAVLPGGATERALPAEPPMGRGQHILLIDDERSLLEVTTRILEQLGYRATACRDAATASALFAADPSRFDLVLTDSNMPGTSGVELIADLRRVRAGFPAVLISGYVTEDLSSLTRAAGGCAVIQKPITREELAQTLHRVFALPPATGVPEAATGDSARRP